MKKALYFIWVMVCGLVIAGCGEQTPDITRARLYKSDLISFSYPGNWTVADEQTTVFPRYVVVASPENTVAAVLVFKSDEAGGLRDFIDQYQDFFNQTAQEKPAAPVFEETDPPRLGVPAFEKGYEIITEKLTIHTAQSDIPHTRTYLRKKTGKTACFIILQCPDKDMPVVERGFRFILDSLAVGKGQ